MPVVNSFASVNDAHPLVTSDPLMTCLNIEGIARLPFEVDSAASHNIISDKCFNRLQKELKLRGKEPSQMLPRTVKIKLADGNMASQNCPVVQLKVSTDYWCPDHRIGSVKIGYIGKFAYIGSEIGSVV